MNMAGLYKLGGEDGHLVIPCPDVLEWGRWMEEQDRRVARTEFGDVSVSTVFIGVDVMADYFDRAPLVFETMVFGGPMDQEQVRYTTWAAAEMGHAVMCDLVAVAVANE